MTPERLRPLTSSEISVKLFVDDPSGVRLKELIPVFHRWIQESLLGDELLVDVASYEQVPKGPGIVLICDTAHYYFDLRAGRPGLRYRSRRTAPATEEEGIARAFRSALQASITNHLFDLLFALPITHLPWNIATLHITILLLGHST